MLEIRYNRDTKELTGWWSRFGDEEVKLENRPNEAIATLDIGIPDKPLGAWLYDETKGELVPNPDYTEPETLVFTSSPPGTAIGQRLNHIEEFLERAYPA